MVFTKYGFQYITNILYLLLEINIERLGLFDLDMSQLII